MFRSGTSSTIYKIQIEKWEGCANRRNDMLTATTQYGDLGRANKCGFFCSGYNTSTHFRNLQKRFLTGKGHGPLQTRHSL
jgi:hypothetical protein